MILYLLIQGGPFSKHISTFELTQKTFIESSKTTVPETVLKKRKATERIVAERKQAADDRKKVCLIWPGEAYAAANQNIKSSRNMCASMGNESNVR